MNFKKIFFILLFLGFAFGYTITDSSFYKNSDINFKGVLNKDIYLGDSDFRQNLVVYESNIDISNYKIQSVCNLDFKLLSKNQNNYIFLLNFLDDKCSNNNFYLKDKENNIISNTSFELNLINDFDLYNKYTDYSTKDLEKILFELDKKQDSLKLYSKVKINSLNINFLKKNRLYLEYIYNINIIKNIIKKREDKYLIPVVGHKLPDGKNISKFPNGPRPYRADYTLGVHEGWDIDAPYGTKVVSLDDGIIINIVSGFKFEDLNKIKKGNISYEEKLINLNYLRGNQVWIKTMKGDVAFYSHLSEINPELKIGDIVKKENFIGKTGITGIPDKNYKDYHLHIELRKNPYNYKKAGNYTKLDYMGWDWYYSTLNVKQLLQNQYNIFQN
ncbi:M23 family metallopeptidase [Candidatus Gracilibacteria bacterium]|nr:M23 family metallopeptidase [Candidatus Gracilibacteria bacterium]